MAHRLRPDWPGRLQKVQALLAEHRVDALVVSAGVNVKYLCGFDGSAGLLLLTASARILIVDRRYERGVRNAMASGVMTPLDLERVETRYDLTLASVCERLGARRAGFEASAVTVATLGAWQRAAPGVDWVATERCVEALRAVKDDLEIATYRRAGRAIAEVAARLGEFVARGRTEEEIARSIDRAIGEAGFSGVAFPTIVASGPNSALPHVRPGPRRLSGGDLVVLDFGGVLDGYCVDLTRMAAVGPVAPEPWDVYSAVRRAHAAALAAVRPGVDASAIDQAAREVLDASGLGQAFDHAAGHGLGLEIHESPRIGRASAEAADVIRAGMVFAIEPAAYVEGLGGVRLEDDVLVTAEGGEVLTDAARDLLVV